MTFSRITNYLRRPEAKAAGWTLGLLGYRKGVTAFIAFLLATTTGAAGYGVFAFAMSLLAILNVIGLLGFEQLGVREVARFCVREEWGLLKGFLRCAALSVLLSALVAVLIGAVSLYFVQGSLSADMLLASRIILAIFPVVAITLLVQAIIRGFQYVLIGQLPETVIRPTLLIILCLSALLFQIGLTPADVLTYFALAAVITCMTAFLFLFGRVPRELRMVCPEYRVSSWLRDSAMLFGFGALITLNARFGILLLGITETAEQTGIFALSNTLAMLLSFVVVAVNRSLGPRIAALLAQEQLAEVQVVILSMTRLAFLAALVPGVGFIFFGSEILGIFGDEFREGGLTLGILTVGQLIYVGAGNAGLTLVMSGNERIATIGMAIGSGVTVILSLVLIPLYGIVGAAIAIATGIASWNIILVTVAYRNLGLATTIVGWSRLRL